jgi:tetratricopeptide repeat protein 21B
MLALARMYLARGDFHNCELQCAALLKAEPDNEEAGIMLADLMFQQKQYDAATFHFQQLLERKPDHWTALAMLLRLLRRAGRLSDAPRFLKCACFPFCCRSLPAMTLKCSVPRFIFRFVSLFSLICACFARS